MTEAGPHSSGSGLVVGDQDVEMFRELAEASGANQPVALPSGAATNHDEVYLTQDPI